MTKKQQEYEQEPTLVEDKALAFIVSIILILIVLIVVLIAYPAWLPF